MKDIDRDRLKELRESPVAFVEEVIGMEPYEYQKEFLEAEGNKVFVAGRQVGKSTVMCWYAIWRWATNPNHDVLIFSPSQRQSLEFFESLKAEIKEWLDSPEDYGITYETKTEIHGSHGSRIVALTAAGSGNTMRGYTTDTVIVDEAAFVEDEFYTSVIAPMLLRTGGDFVLTGTPWGKSGYLYEKFNDDRWFSTSISTLECPDVSMDVVEELKDDLTRSEYQREVMGQFVDRENAAFPEEIVKPCIHRGEDVDDVYPSYNGGACFLGVDPARFGTDRAVYVSIDDDGNVFDVVSVEESSLTEVEGMVRKLDSERGYDKILIDETGVGGGAIDNLYNKINVEGLEFTLRSKQEIYQNLKKVFEDERVTIPDERWIVQELRNIEYELTEREHIKYGAPDGARDDFVDALALAFWSTGNVRSDYAKRMHTFSTTGEEGLGSRKKAYSFGS